MRRSWEEDRKTLETYGCEVIPLRELEYFIEAEVAKDGNRMEIQWGTDSAYRFFPLQRDPDVGFILHPIDLAANKLAALVGRTEPRDWIDVITATKVLSLKSALAAGEVVFHEGTIGGAWPTIIG